MSNEYYDHTSFPTPGSGGSSAGVRAELRRIEDGFNLLPILGGNAGRLVVINSAGNALEASTLLGVAAGALVLGGGALSGAAINGTFASPPPIGATAPSTGKFTTLEVTGSINSPAFTGMVTSLSGGFQFPDGTIQSTAAGDDTFTDRTAMAILTFIGY